MNLGLQILIIVLTLFIASYFFFKKAIVKALVRLSNRLMFSTLRTAIHEADKDKSKTNRKNIVVFNTDQKRFEPVQKKLLKASANYTKNKSNSAMTPGRKRNLKIQKRVLTNQRVRTIEKKSLYVTN